MSKGQPCSTGNIVRSGSARKDALDELDPGSLIAAVVALQGTRRGRVLNAKARVR